MKPQLLHRITDSLTKEDILSAYCIVLYNKSHGFYEYHIIPNKTICFNDSSINRKPIKFNDRNIDMLHEEWLFEFYWWTKATWSMYIIKTEQDYMKHRFISCL